MNVVLNGRVCRPESGALLEDLRQFARECGKVSVTYNEYRLAGRFYPTIFVRRFGSWNSALVAAGLEPCKLFNVSGEMLLENLEGLWVALGRQPVMADLVPPLSRFGRRPYVRVFGSWSNALIRMAELRNGSMAQSGFSLTPALSKGEGGVTCDDRDTLRQSVFGLTLLRQAQYKLPSKGEGGVTYPSNNKGLAGVGEIMLSDYSNLKFVSKRATPREPGWRLRYMVLKRDLFRCVACGASPATNLGTVLHVDHIVAYSIGGESVMENLQTLCEVCNGGKGNL